MSALWKITVKGIQNITSSSQADTLDCWVFLNTYPWYIAQYNIVQNFNSVALS